MTALRLRSRTLRAVLFCVAGTWAICSGAAHAASQTVNCQDLQGALDQATSGDVITLTETCTKDNSGDVHGSFQLPTGQAITLQGAPGAGFDGAGADSRILFGQDVGGTVISGLTFRNGQAPSGGSGGAVLIQGTSAPVFQSDQFFNNSAEGLGGAVALLTPAAGSGTVVLANSVVGSRSGGAGNQATTGGAVYIQTSRRVEVRSNLFAGNSAADTGGAVAINSSSDILFNSNLVEGNHAAGGGGGVQLCCAQLTITSSAFRSNRIDDPNGTFPTHRGGGVLATSADGGAPGHVMQFGNVFDSNAIAFSNASASGGGGEYLIGTNLESRNDLFLSNALQGPASGGDSHGAGLRSTDCNGGELLTRVENGVVAGNVLGAGAAGAGISAGCSSGVNHLTVLQTTMAGNATPDGGGPTLDGGNGDSVLVANSIVAPQPGTAAVGGFGARTATFSDMCDPGNAAQPFPGDGNICAPPLLINPAPGVGDFHQTAGSPTIDAGSNALVAGDLGVDADGDTRITDGNGDGNAVVDMGADESPAVPLIPGQEPPPRVVGPDVPGPPPPEVVVTTRPNKPQRVVYVRVIITRHHGRYLLTRITGRGRARIRLRLLDGKHRSHSVTRTVRTNRPVTVKNLPLVGIRLIRVTVLS
jgi:hypothetical protein